MSVLLQISDTHFGTEQPAVVLALVSLAKQLRPEVVVLSGDITQRARPEQFDKAKAFVDQLGAPVLAIAGNHDIALFDLWERLRRPYARYAAVFGSDLEPVYTSHDLLIVGVNTTRASRHKNGEVSNAQIDRVAKRLQAASRWQLRVVVVHQPVAVTLEKDRTNLLRGHEVATRVWSAAGADVVMGGHIHLPYTQALQGLARRTWVVQAGTAVSSRTRAGSPNSVNVLRWPMPPPEHGTRSVTERPERAPSPGSARPPEEVRGNLGADRRFLMSGGCVVEQWDYAQTDRMFVCARSIVVQPDRG